MSISIHPTITSEYLLGLSYIKLKQSDNAISAFKRAITLYKPRTLVRNQVGLITAEDEELKSIYIHLVSAYVFSGHPNDAISLVNGQALKKFPSNPDLYVGLAIANTYINNHQEALKAISQAYKVRPDEYITTLYTRIKNNLPLDVQPL